MIWEKLISAIMKRNFNKPGRVTRFAIGIILLIIGFTNILEDDLLEKIVIGAGIFILFTALIYFCPLYYFLGIDTYKSGKRPKMY